MEENVITAPKTKTTFDSAHKCKEAIDYTKQSNPRFPLFNQNIYHAGDMYDIERYGMLYARESQLNTNTSENLKKTICYIFDHLKKAILVVFQDGKISSFLPFSKHDAKIDPRILPYLFFDEKDRNLLKAYRDAILANKEHVAEKLYNQKIVPRFSKYAKLKGWQRTNADRREWVMNNCIFRNTYPFFEGDHGVAALHYFLRQLTQREKIPDCAVIFNVRDFPICHKDPHRHPYTNVVPSSFHFTGRPVLPYPILSFCGGHDFLDIPIPTYDDISRVTQKFFTNECTNPYTTEVTPTKWDSKKPTAIWRGTTTGCGVDPSTNMRLRLVQELGKKYPQLMDVAVSSINDRVRKPSAGKPISALLVEPKPQLGRFVDNQEKSQHKYVINLDGHSRAYRLSSELGMNVVVLLQKSPYCLWFEKKLVPYQHFVPVAQDLSDLVEKIRWCQQHDKECGKIADQALVFYQKYLQPKAVYHYLAKTIRQNCVFPVSSEKEFPRHGMTIITVYRDDKEHTRKQQLQLFINHMDRLFGRYKVHIIVVEQSEEHPFNIGALKNIGMHLVPRQNRKGTVILTDIDMLPDTSLHKFYVRRAPPKKVLALAWRGTRYLVYEKNPFVGGAISVQWKDFTQSLNGYSNVYYGWGGEDNDLVIRCQLAGIGITYPSEGGVLDTELSSSLNLKTPLEKLKQEVQDTSRWEKIMDCPRRWKDEKEGWATVPYTKLQDVHKQLPCGGQYHHVTVRLPGNPTLPHIAVTKETYKAFLKHHYSKVRVQRLSPRSI